MLWMSFHYTASPANVITSDAYDPITKTGEYKVAAVKIEKI
jgi:formate dehydrogenase alpha subunit